VTPVQEKQSKSDVIDQKIDMKKKQKIKTQNNKKISLQKMINNAKQRELQQQAKNNSRLSLTDFLESL